ncbi:hypothetical protein ACFOZ0_27555 [Streptomyces yaanensis]|uniref:PE-PGRS family protein n=1 Tax=Streptomyces yaanensis TaxID=1142239 RepID=A0ABV7SKV2_9ACTN|nr:hypothetical protein [Streptomyces sp. CGMCC 4.7035]WNB97022.1 hypothetical protein Q2K21_02460 [Streptomyces sp. CGMCC 4.7035]
MTAGWCSRTIRAAVFAAVCVLLAALGHVLMSGSDVPAWALAAGVAVTGAAGWCLAARERGLPLIVTVVVAAQAVLHSAFSLAQQASGGSAAMDMGAMDMGAMDMGAMAQGMGSMGMGSMRMDSMDMGHMGMSRMSPSMAGTSSFGMLAAHLLAALLCGLWLAYGEKAAFRVLRAVAGWLAAPLRLLLTLPVTPDRPRVRVRRRRSERAPRLLLLVHAITSRGPPVGTAVI